jgi:hypothetical protein
MKSWLPFNLSTLYKKYLDIRDSSELSKGAVW